MNLPGWPRDTSPFHAGEQAIQARLGVRDRMETAGRRVIRDFMPNQHRELFAQLPWALIGSLDAQGRPWASTIVGHAGFLSTPDSRTMRIGGSMAYGDPLRESLAVGASIGFLGIQLETRRRNRMNGTVTRIDDESFEVHVEQSFGNCPQYIQSRVHRFIVEPHTIAARRPVHREKGALSAAAVALARSADTFFIATRSAATQGHAPNGVDISHRGGKPGFVRVTEEAGATTFTVPDFRGNSMYMTLGNLQLDPRAGLVFVDFDFGNVLLLTGTATVIWEGAEVTAFAGAERLLRFRVTEGLSIENAMPLRWTPPEQARQLAATGSWS